MQIAIESIKKGIVNLIGNLRPVAFFSKRLKNADKQEQLLSMNWSPLPWFNCYLHTAIICSLNLWFILTLKSLCGFYRILAEFKNMVRLWNSCFYLSLKSFICDSMRTEALIH